jgi:hypothetical protein
MIMYQEEYGGGLCAVLLDGETVVEVYCTSRSDESPPFGLKTYSTVEDIKSKLGKATEVRSYSEGKGRKLIYADYNTFFDLEKNSIVSWGIRSNP